jgi:hypothetical protein
MKTVEMVQHQVRPVDDREGHLPFEPFSRKEWAVTLLLALLCFGLPVAMVVRYEREMARQAALVLRSGGQVAHE